MHEIFLRRVDANHTVLQKMNIKTYFLQNNCKALERGATVTRNSRMSFNLDTIRYLRFFRDISPSKKDGQVFPHFLLSLELRPANDSTSRASSPTLCMRGVGQR